MTQKPMKNNGAYLPSSFNASLYLGEETRTLNGSELSSMWRASANRLIINKYLMLPNLAIVKSQILIYCKRLSISFQSHTHHIVYSIRINKAIYLPVSFKSQAFFITLQPKWTRHRHIRNVYLKVILHLCTKKESFTEQELKLIMFGIALCQTRMHLIISS